MNVLWDKIIVITATSGREVHFADVNEISIEDISPFAIHIDPRSVHAIAEH